MSTADALESRFVRFAGGAAVGAAVASLLNLVLTGAAAGFNPANNPYHSPAAAAAVDGGAALIRWSLVADFLGYYLLLLPLAIALHAAMARRSPSWAQLLTVAGVGSLLLGAAGAAALAATWPALIDAYRSADASGRPMQELVYVTLSRAIYGGVWNMVDSTLHGAWVLGVGLLLGDRHPKLGKLGVVLGAVTLLDAVAAVVMPGPVHEAVLFGYLLLTPVWSLSWGLVLLRGRFARPSEI